MIRTATKVSYRAAPRTRANLYEEITAKIVAAIEAGAGEWRMPWHHNGDSTSRPINVVSRKPYRGVNVVVLWVAAQAAGYPTGLWGTYRHWQSVGAQVRRGERATTVVFWKTRGAEPGEDEDENERPRVFARGYSVFNQAQLDGYVAPERPALPETERLAHAEAFYSNLNIATVYGGSEACYLPSKDTVFMPPFAAFHDAAAHYSTLYHEGIHATAVKHRCDRDLSARFGSEAYAMEEIIADLGSCSAIFTAASKAQQATDWMHAQQPKPSAPDP